MRYEVTGDPLYKVIQVLHINLSRENQPSSCNFPPKPNQLGKRFSLDVLIPIPKRVFFFLIPPNSCPLHLMKLLGQADHKPNS